MARKRRPGPGGSPRGPRPGGGRRPSRGQGLEVRRVTSGQGWMLVHPPCARERTEDLDEVRNMLAAEEFDAARDELRWLLDGCSELLEAHFLLGKLAVEVEGDVPLGRGHFGIGYQLGARALQRQGQPTPLPALHPGNRAFFDCGRGLAWCLNELGKLEMAQEVVEHLLACDPTDPLGLRAWLDDIRTADKPLIELHLPLDPPPTP